MDKTSSKLSIKELREAISKLEAYSLQIESPESSISKTISLVRAILSIHFNPSTKKYRHVRNPSNKNEVLTVVELINRNRLLIAKLNEGTPAEQELAEHVTKTINLYNENCDKRIQLCVSNRQRLANFFSKNKQEHQELPKIALHKKVTTQRHYPEHFSQKKISNFSSGIVVPISKQSAELFHMKAIALLERYGIASNPEARAFVKKSPIYTKIEENTSICTLTQTLSLFPGQTIVVMGNSSLDPITHAISQLFPETFSLSLESTQTGFPHPIQRAGWTVAGQLLPDFPQRIDLLNETANFFYRRNQAIVELLPHGSLFKAAKELLFLKKKCFEAHAEEFMDLQKTLIYSILQAASSDKKSFKVVELFFKSLSNHPNPLDALADVSHLIRESFMVKPHQELLDAIIKGKSTNFGNPDPEVRYIAAKALLDQAFESAIQDIRRQKDEPKLLNEQIKFSYIECLGSLLGKASQQIFLQYLSEDLMFEPQTLTPFESQLQTIAYIHLKDFLDELLMPLEEDKNRNPDRIYELIKKHILLDIALFQEKKPSSISKELSEYFQKRYKNLSTLGFNE